MILGWNTYGAFFTNQEIVGLHGSLTYTESQILWLYAHT